MNIIVCNICHYEVERLTEDFIDHCTGCGELEGPTYEFNEDDYAEHFERVTA